MTAAGCRTEYTFTTGISGETIVLVLSNNDCAWVKLELSAANARMMAHDLMSRADQIDQQPRLTERDVLVRELERERCRRICADLAASYRRGDNPPGTGANVNVRALPHPDAHCYGAEACAEAIGQDSK